MENSERHKDIFGCDSIPVEERPTTNVPMVSISSGFPVNEGWLPHFGYSLNLQPWKRNSINYPAIMRFTGSGQHTEGPSTYPDLVLNKQVNDRLMVFKRKRPPLTPVFDIETPSKIHISEEQMANRLDSMHISTMYTSHNGNKNNSTSSDSCNVTGISNDSVADTDNGLPKLIICDELRQLQAPNVLPRSLMDKFQDNSSKALVLWKPPQFGLPGNLIKTIDSSITRESAEINIDEENDEDYDDDDNEVKQFTSSSCLNNDNCGGECQGICTCLKKNIFNPTILISPGRSNLPNEFRDEEDDMCMDI